MNSKPRSNCVQCLAALLFIAIAGFVPAAHGGPLRERLQQRATQAQPWDDQADSRRSQPAPVLPAGTRVLRDPYTNKPYVGFYTTKRVGGMLVDSQAVKVLTLSAA